MATLGFIEYEQATPEVRAVYDDIMATRKSDRVNNFWKALAHGEREALSGDFARNDLGLGRHTRRGRAGSPTPPSERIGIGADHCQCSLWQHVGNIPVGNPYQGGKGSRGLSRRSCGIGCHGRCGRMHIPCLDMVRCPWDRCDVRCRVGSQSLLLTLRSTGPTDSFMRLSSPSRAYSPIIR